MPAQITTVRDLVVSFDASLVLYYVPKVELINKKLYFQYNSDCAQRWLSIRVVFAITVFIRESLGVTSIGTSKRYSIIGLYTNQSASIAVGRIQNQK